jgi:hypothetical protein
MSPIVWELGLVIVATVGFGVWQWVTLRRDMAITQREKAAREAAERDADGARDAASAPAGPDRRAPEGRGQDGA